MNISEELEKSGLSPETYESCWSDIQDKLDGTSDLDWSEIKTKYNLSISSETLRKACSATPFGSYFVTKYFENKNENNDEQYIYKLAELRKEKQKLFDERAAINKINRENSRVEQDLEFLAKLIETDGKHRYSPVRYPVISGNNDLLACISDLHLGVCYKGRFGEYNSDIAQEYLANYAQQIITQGKLNNCRTVNIVLLGDMISGSIHPTIQLENRENVVRQIEIASRALTDFTYDIADNFSTVNIYSVGGNHSRIGQKDSVLRDERLDDLIPWYMECALKHLGNVHVHRENIESTVSEFEIQGKKYCAVHGDFDSFSETGLQKLSMTLGYIPDVVLFGHFHHCSFDTVGNTKIIRSGTFCAADEYTVGKRLVSKPEQIVCVCSSDGVETIIPMRLKRNE